jgi:DNA mismatch repair protein MutL
VAQVELKTKREIDNLGTQINIDGGTVELQEPCQCATGASFSVKNLFFNVPARRNFLKDDGVELKHIVEEFERVALAHPDVAFSLNSNKNDIFVLPVGNLIQRICNLFGSHLQEKLIGIEESTPYLKVRGYIGRPDAAVKRKKVQYLFVNNRFIRSPYIHYAIVNAYADLIAADANPHYYVFLDLPPNSIDINIHPTKTEIKFEDEKTVFMLLQSTAKRALGKANLAPTLEFNNENTFDIDYSKYKLQSV